MATKSVVDNGTCCPGNVIKVLLAHKSRSISIASRGDGTWLGAIRGRSPRVVVSVCKITVLHGDIFTLVG